MTVDLHRDTVERARERGGGPAEDRPASIDDTLTRPELGYREGDPLVEGCDTYEDYPHVEELAEPKWGTWLRKLFSHPHITSYDDAVAEVTPADERAAKRRTRDALERAARTFDLPVEELFAKGEDERENGREDRLTSLLGYKPAEGVVDVENALFVAELYTLGLSDTEIADVVAHHTGEQARAGQVRDTLRTVGLLEGPTTDEARERFEENDARLGGTTLDFSETEDSNPGVNINSETVANDPNISVERE